MSKVLALDINGKLTWCKATPENRGKGTCKHTFHQLENESPEDFLVRANAVNVYNEEAPDDTEILVDKTKEKNRLFEILGTKDVTPENLMDLINALPVEKRKEAFDLGFDCAYKSNFFIDIEKIDPEEEKITFSNMYDYKLGAKKKHIDQILTHIGDYIQRDGSTVDIKGNFKDGVTDDEFWSMMYATRKASVNKTVSIATPGAEARYLYYGLSDFYIADGDCGSEGHDILSCKAPGGMCECCARKAGAGKVIDILKKQNKNGKANGIKIGGLVSSNLTEPLTQCYLDAIHNSSSKTSHTNIVSLFDCYSSNPVIKQAAECKTTAEKRQVLYNGLKELYSSNGIAIDDYNLQIIVKKMTSYKRTAGGLKLISDGEDCDIVSARSIGNASNSLYKKAALQSSFKVLSRGGVNFKLKTDSFNDIHKTKM